MKANRWISFLLALVLVCCALPGRAYAIDLIDTDKAVSLTVVSKFDGVALVGEQFDLYKVADADEQCNLTPTKAFRPYLTEDLNKMDDWGKLNRQLYKAVLDNPDEFKADYTAKTDSKGEAKFTVGMGLYLIVGHPIIQDKRQFTQNPILIMLPNRPAGQDSWDYDVEAITKPQQPLDLRKVKIVKVWDDKNNAYHRRPKKLDVYIRNEVGDKLEITLPQNGKWEYTWDEDNGLEFGHTWEAYENKKQLNGYHLLYDEVGIDKDGDLVLTLTNYYREPDPDKLPQTGQLWWPVPVLLSAGLLMLLLGMLRRRGEKHDA